MSEATRPGLRHRPRRNRRAGVAVQLSMLAVAVVWLFAFNAPPALTTSAAQETLGIEASPGAISLDKPRFVLRVSNSGMSPIRNVRVWAQPLAGMRLVTRHEPIPLLSAGSSVLVRVRLDGKPTVQPRTLSLVARGDATSGRTTAVTSVGIVPREPKLVVSIAGTTTLTDTSPAQLMAILRNTSDADLDVELSAAAPPHRVFLEPADAEPTEGPVPITVPAQRAIEVPLRIEPGKPLRRGSTALVLTATTDTYDVTQSMNLEARLAADTLTGPLGLGLVLVPGVIGVWAGLMVWSWDRRRIGLEPPAVSRQIWDNKGFLLAAAVISVGCTALFNAAFDIDMFEAPRFRDIVIASSLCALVVTLLALVVVWAYRCRVPAVTPLSEPLEVLKAMPGTRSAARGPVFATPEGVEGFLVLNDRGALILSPPILFQLRAVSQANERGAKLAEVVRLIDTEKDAETYLEYERRVKFVGSPRAVVRATFVRNEQFMTYVEPEEE